MPYGGHIVAAYLDLSFEGEIKIGGNYVSTVRHGDVLPTRGTWPLT